MHQIASFGEKKKKKKSFWQQTKEKNIFAQKSGDWIPAAELRGYLLFISVMDVNLCELNLLLINIGFSG